MAFPFPPNPQVEAPKSSLGFLALWQIEYFNNQIIVDLVEEPHKGIIAILDEACLTVGRVTDALFLESMNSRLGKHPHFTSRKVRSREAS